jgi:BolA protein
VIKERIELNLKKAFASTLLEVIDESHLHVGHTGHKPGQQTHFSVTLVSDRFNGLSRLERHRLVYKALEGELNAGVHALQLNLVSAEESGELE